VEQKSLAIKLGAADCMIKPVSRAGLLAVVRRLTPREGQFTVLIVDDNPQDGDLSSAVVQSVGALAVWTNSGAEGLRAIRNHRPDAVLLDLVMPEMDGFEVLEAIRNDPAMVGLPVYILTSKDLTEEELRFLSQRTQAIFRKTGNWNEELQVRVSEIVRQDALAKKIA
jgi:DNA-binding response OmpR family regulator